MTKMCRFYFEIIKLLKGRAELNCHLPYIPYFQWLEFLTLHTLENRRKTYDLAFTHKILHEDTHFKSDGLFKISNRKNCYLLSKNQT